MHTMVNDQSGSRPPRASVLPDGVRHPGIAGLRRAPRRCGTGVGPGRTTDRSSGGRWTLTPGTLVGCAIEGDVTECRPLSRTPGNGGGGWQVLLHIVSSTSVVRLTNPVGPAGVSQRVRRQRCLAVPVLERLEVGLFDPVAAAQVRVGDLGEVAAGELEHGEVVVRGKDGVLVEAEVLPKVAVAVLLAGAVEFGEDAASVEAGHRRDEDLAAAAAGGFQENNAGVLVGAFVDVGLSVDHRVPGDPVLPAQVGD